MEVLRQLGLEETVWGHVPPSEHWRRFRYCTSLLGDDLAVMDHFRTEEFKFLGSLSPCRVAQLSQPILENILSEAANAAAESSGAKVLTGHIVQDLAPRSEDGGVNVTIRPTNGGPPTTVAAQYVVGADGTRSAVRRALGITSRGEHDMESFASIHFTSRELGKRLAKDRRGAMLSFVFSPDVLGVVVSHDLRRGDWVIHAPFFPPAQSLEDICGTEEACIEIIRQCCAPMSTHKGAEDDPLRDLELHSVRAWGMHATCATSFAGMGNRVFLAGDAAHQFPPSGGFGVNAGLVDAHNLVWKLAYTLQGKAGPSLLASYDLERRPVIEDALSVAVDNYRRGLLPARAMGLERNLVATAVSMLGQGGATLPWAGDLVSGMLTVGKQHLRSPALVKSRVKRVVEEDQDALPLLFPRTDKGFRYFPEAGGVARPASSPTSTPRDLSPSEFWLKPRLKRGTQTDIALGTSPGQALPHAWILERDSNLRLSTIDIISAQLPAYTLLYAMPSIWRPALETLHQKYGKAKTDRVLRGVALVPLQSPDGTTGDTGDFKEAVYVYEANSPWEQLREISERGALLVRPDGHIAAQLAGPSSSTPSASPRDLSHDILDVLEELELRINCN
ncbi:FAD-dependent monooxygenase apdD [Hondaea fermentalgiana]|uniref:FAD-dependent monooxygenase apdD n=1 Tax=Hondaea fermentalgiana TaxID=2315210 RepID=A0A2R5GAK0_9STRA|nr:FAD-dependent monooxygenase apdD [Hondaea fermentalgiana]|eukprot:GBG24714.1 FAD-dependent monooxygenase apdD [Hondaea fermentalgiana]